MAGTNLTYFLPDFGLSYHLWAPAFLGEGVSQLYLFSETTTLINNSPTFHITDRCQPFILLTGANLSNY
jgi:hypothetical protein